jgi:DNA-directed RNA polymerase subunit RPC12/RpoP
MTRKASTSARSPTADLALNLVMATTKVSSASSFPLPPAAARTLLTVSLDPPSDNSDFDVERDAQDGDDEDNASNVAGTDDSNDADVDTNTTEHAPANHSSSKTTRGDPAPTMPPTYANFSVKREEPLKYICARVCMERVRDTDGTEKLVFVSPCEALVEVRLGEAMRCRGCGSRMLLKCRTARMVQFDAR